MDLERNQQREVIDDIKTTPFRLTRESRALLCKWMDERTMPQILLDNLPKLGVMVWYKNAPVGVCFIRQVEGGTGMIDGFLCDPSIDYSIRNICLDQLIIDILKLAVFHDMRGVFGLTLNKRVLSRAKKLGFSVMSAHRLVSASCSLWNNIGVQ